MREHFGSPLDEAHDDAQGRASAVMIFKLAGAIRPPQAQSSQLFILISTPIHAYRERYNAGHSLYTIQAMKLYGKTFQRLCCRDAAKPLLLRG